jgi:hypothetical protein
MSITNSSVLTEMNISVWTANKVDKNATDTVLSDHAAVKSAAQVKKNLMAGTSARKNIAEYAQACRTWHSARTLPWSDRGPRLLPTSLFMDYKTEANVRKATFDNMVSQFLLDYHQHVAQSAHYLGSLFDVEDYPHVEEVREKFGFRLVFSPLPETGDFRLDLPTQDLEEMKQGYEQAFESRLADAMRAPWEQLHSTLTTMSEKLTEQEPTYRTKTYEDGSTEEVKVVKRYHDTLITNAQDLCRMLTHLNVTKDPKLEQARRDLENAILGTDMDEIKEYPQVRADVKSKLDAMLKEYEW